MNRKEKVVGNTKHEESPDYHVVETVTQTRQEG